jgi:TRAP-type mannitol/chloroaromatic compound transport system permease small subunit
MWDAVVWFVRNLALAFYNLGYAVSHPASWLDWSDPESLMRFVYYGGSTQFFFVVFVTFLIVTAVGVWRTGFLWFVVRLLEGFANSVGRFFAWAGLVMVLVQTMVIFLQAIFRVPSISVSPFGLDLTMPLGWWGDGLKLFNAMIVCLCCTYTFVQGGHVRVDLFYASAKYNTKKVVDMIGSLFFVMPMAVLIWVFGWFFMWRHLITPKVSFTDTLDRMLLKARAFRWNVETIGFSPNGFNAYFVFKLLLVAFAGMIFLQAVAFFYRSYLEWREGPSSAGRYLDSDVLEPGEVEMAAPEHLAREGR